MGERPLIALLGGGQLGRMFIENALRYNVDIHVLDPDPSAPCSALASRFVVGDLRWKDAVLAFAADADIIGIEIEQVNVDALEELERMGKRVVPSSGVLRTIQDKGLQKQFYADHEIPTTDFVLLHHGAEAVDHAHLFPAFLKSRTGGYDGKGVMALHDKNDLEHAFTGPCVLERMADIELELAVLVVRSDDGSMVSYDPVEMVFDPVLNLVDHLRAPSRAPMPVLASAKILAERVAAAFGAPGLYAVELFLTKQGELLVNETAPRAHNSGHHTIEACSSSQFDQLLRCYMQWPLGDVHLREHAAMVNLVGTEGDGIPAVRGLAEVLEMPGSFLHMYGKQRTRTGRKMGHVTLLAVTHEQLDRSIAVTKASCRVVPDDVR